MTEYCKGCFASVVHPKFCYCGVLKEPIKGKVCPFYKTTEEYKDGQRQYGDGKTYLIEHGAHLYPEKIPGGEF